MVNDESAVSSCNIYVAIYKAKVISLREQSTDYECVNIGELFDGDMLYMNMFCIKFYYEYCFLC